MQIRFNQIDCKGRNQLDEIEGQFCLFQKACMQMCVIKCKEISVVRKGVDVENKIERGKFVYRKSISTNKTVNYIIIFDI